MDLQFCEIAVAFRLGEDLARCISHTANSTEIFRSAIVDRVVIEQDGGNKRATSSDAGWASRRIEVIDLVRTREGKNEWDRYGRSR